MGIWTMLLFAVKGWEIKWSMGKLNSYVFSLVEESVYIQVTLTFRVVSFLMKETKELKMEYYNASLCCARLL